MPSYKCFSHYYSRSGSPSIFSTPFASLHPFKGNFALFSRVPVWLGLLPAGAVSNICPRRQLKDVKDTR